MPEYLESLVNVKKIEEIKSKEEANRYLELGWKLLKIAEEREKDEGGYYNVVIYCVGWYSSEEPKYSKKQKIDINERRPYLKTKRRGFMGKLTKILVFVLVWIISVYLVFNYFCPQQHSPNRITDISSIIREIFKQLSPDRTKDTVIECIDFESLRIGNVYNVGDTFTDSGVTITVLPFQWGNNLWTSDGFAQVVDNGCAGVSGKEINVNNVNLGFNFNGPLRGLSLNFGEYGGNLNIEINDVFQNFENFVNINTIFDGVNVSVINGYGNDKIRLILSGEMGMFDFQGQDFMFVIGGQELCVDHVCPSL